MTAEDAVKKLDEVSTDPEAGHGEAEDVLLDLLEALGHKAVADAFRRAADRVGFWYA